MTAVIICLLNYEIKIITEQQLDNFWITAIIQSSSDCLKGNVF